MKSYLEESAFTCSDQWYGDKLHFVEFIKALEAAIDALREVDSIKKLLFYGKEFAKRMPETESRNCNNLSNYSNRDIIHGILGMATEAGELLEALYWQVVSGKPFDETNIIEEVGDSQWYEALIARTLKTSFDEIQKRNIEKLRKRYPNNFTEYDALNRDLTGERKVLERTEKLLTAI